MTDRSKSQLRKLDGSGTKHGNERIGNFAARHGYR